MLKSLKNSRKLSIYDIQWDKLCIEIIEYCNSGQCVKVAKRASRQNHRKTKRGFY